MNYRLRIKNVESEGPFSIYTLSLTSDTWVLFESAVGREIMTQGKIISIPDDTRGIRVVNDCDGCGNEQIVCIAPGALTPTPTLTSTPYPTPTSVSQNAETSILPNWLKDVAIASDSNTYDFTSAVHETQDLQIRVQSLNGTAISGFTFPVLPWNNNTWIEGY